MLDATNLTSPNSLCGYVVLLSVPVAITPSNDTATKVIAACVAMVAGLGFILTTAGRGETFTASDIAKLPPHEPITPASLTTPGPPVEKRDPPIADQEAIDATTPAAVAARNANRL